MPIPPAGSPEWADLTSSRDTHESEIKLPGSLALDEMSSELQEGVPFQASIRIADIFVSYTDFTECIICTLWIGLILVLTKILMLGANNHSYIPVFAF